MSFSGWNPTSKPTRITGKVKCTRFWHEKCENVTINVSRNHEFVRSDKWRRWLRRLISGNVQCRKKVFLNLPQMYPIVSCWLVKQSPCVIHQKNSKTLRIKHLKGFHDLSIYSREKVWFSFDTNFGTQCTSVASYLVNGTYTNFVL